MATAETAHGDDALYNAVYDELKRIARGHLRSGEDRATLNTTELVHEAFLKLSGRQTGWDSRAHFFGAASRAMRQVLVDFARRRHAVKRNGAGNVGLFENGQAKLDIEFDRLLELEKAMQQLEAVDRRLCQVVEMRFFGGVSEEEIAQMLGVSVRTVERDWLKARLFLLQQMGGGAIAS